MEIICKLHNFSLNFNVGQELNIQEATLLGEEYNVVPAVLVVEGVHSGSEGPVFFDKEVLKKNIKVWNGKPVSSKHPEGGESCCDPKVLEKQWLGYVFDTAYNDDKKRVTANLWLHKQRAYDTLRKVREGEKIDVSMGIWAELDSVEGWWKEKKYVGTVRSLSPDHLAILSNEQGACSWEDGCGIRMKKESMINLILSEARYPSFSGIEEISWGKVGKTFKDYVNGYYKHSGENMPKGNDSPVRVKDASLKLKRWVARKTLLGDPKAETDRDLIFFPVVNPSTDKLNVGALRAVLGGRGSLADIPTKAKESAMLMAKKLLNSKFGKEIESNENQSKGEGIVSKENKKVQNEKGTNSDVSSAVEERQEKNVEFCGRDNAQKSLNSESPKNKEESIEVKKTLTLSEVLDSVPFEVKELITEGVSMVTNTRKEMINKIRSIEGLDFCEKSLTGLPTEFLVKMAKLTSLAQGEKNVFAKNIDSSWISDYSLQGGKKQEPKSKFIPMPIIDWNKS